MPQAAATWIASTIFAGATAVGFSAGVASTIAVWGTNALAFAGNMMLMSAISKSMAPKVPDVSQQAASSKVTVRSTVEPRHIVYGTTQKSGVLAYSTVTGGSNEQLWMVVVVAGHEVDDITDINIDGQTITDAQITDAPNVNPTGVNVTDPAAPFADYIAIQRMLGSSTQTHSTFLASADATNWDSTKDGRGNAYVIIRATFQQPESEDDEQVWKSAPQNVRATIRGRKIYDPRLDSTEGGSGSHRYTDASTWEWSENPALCVLDYLTDTDFGMGESHTRCDLDTFATAANICEETVSLPASGSEDRFTCNGWVHTGMAPTQILEGLLSSMQGALFYSQGEFRCYAAAYDAPSHSLSDDDLRGKLQVRASLPRSEKFNAVQATFIDPARSYQSAECFAATSSTYETEDGGEQIKNNVNLPMTNSETMAQRICMMVLESGRMGQTVTFPANMVGYKVDVWDTVNLTIDELGWSSKVFRVTGMTQNPDGGIDLVAREEIAAVYTDPGVGDYTTLNAAGVVVHPTENPPVPTNLAIDAQNLQMTLSWTNGAPRLFEFVEIYVNTTDDSGTATKAGESKSNTFIYHPSTSATRYFWVRTVNRHNVRSAFTASVSGASSLVVDAGMSDPGLVNANIDINADGTLSGAGSGQVDALQVINAPAAAGATANTGALADLDSVDLAGGTVTGTLPSTKADPDLKNVSITIDADGTLNGAGGGQVTIGGLGFTGDLGATTNNVTESAIDPTGGVDGDMHYNTATKIWWVKIGGVWLARATYNIGALADLDTISATEIETDAVTTPKILAGQITSAKLASALVYAGEIEIDTSGRIRSGKTAYSDTLAGWWLGNDAGTPKFHIGDASSWLKWTGTELDVKGDVTVTSGAIVSGSLKTSAAGAGRVELTNSAAPIDIYTTVSGASRSVFSVDTETGRLQILGDLEANSVSDAGFFDAAGIADLQARLGTSAPGNSTGGSVYLSMPQATIPSFPHTTAQTNMGDTGASLTGELNSGGNDITLRCKLYGSEGYGEQGSNQNWVAPTYDIYWEYSTNNGVGWSTVTGSTQSITGTAFNTEEPDGWYGQRKINATATFVWTGGTTAEYLFRAVIDDTGGTVSPSGTKCTLLDASEEVAGDGAQDLWATIAGDTGSTTADATADTLTIAGGTNISTAVSGDTLTISHSGLATLASPAFTGTPTAPTQSANDNSTKLATTAYADAAAGGGGDVSASGTPANNQIAVWTDASTIEGDANLTWDGASLNVISTISEFKSVANAATALHVGNRTLQGDGSDGILRVFGEHIGTVYGAEFKAYSGNCGIAGSAYGGATPCTNIQINMHTSVMAGNSLFCYSVGNTESVQIVHNAGIGIVRTNTAGDLVLQRMGAEKLRCDANGISVTGDVIADDFEATTLGPNTDPGADSIRLGGYGVLGNRSAVYISNVSGPVFLNHTGVHGVNKKFETTSTGVKVTGAMTTEHTAASLHRNVFHASNVTAQQVDLHLKNAHGDAYIGLSYNAADDGLYYDSRSGAGAGEHEWRVNGTSYMHLDTTGLTVTGTMTADDVSCATAFRTQDYSASGNVSGAEVYSQAGQGGQYLEVGYNTAPLKADASHTLEEQDAGGFIAVTNASRAYTLPATSNVDFPVGSMVQIAVDSDGNTCSVTTVSGVTLSWFDGTDVNDLTVGSRTISHGGWATLYRKATNHWYMVGAGIS